MSKANRIALEVVRLKKKVKFFRWWYCNRDISIHDFSHCHDDYSPSEPATYVEKPTLYRLIQNVIDMKTSINGSKNRMFKTECNSLENL